MPASNHFSMLIVAEAHRKVLHNGIRDTLNMVRQRYWILKGRAQVKKYIRKCIICRKLEGAPPTFNVTPDLPNFRVDDAPPFTHTGVDFAGPLMHTGINAAKTSENKCYVCLFTCASTRAVHLELVESLDVNAFIRCFRRFGARRGLPSTVISDNAKTFKSMSKEVKALMRSPLLSTHFASQGVKWKFIVDRSPWQGGMWGRLIRSVKRCLYKVIGRALLSYIEVSTLLVEVECVINSRPITYVYDDSEGVSYPLTPSHLIYGRNILQGPNERHAEVVSTYETLSRRSKYSRTLLDHFSKRWKNLLSLMEVYKKKQVDGKPLLDVGDVALLKNDNAKRSFWRLCRIIELFPGKDGHIRAAKIEVSSPKGKVSLKRPLQHLIPLEVESSDSAVQRVPVDSTVVQTPATRPAPAKQSIGSPPAQDANQSARPKRNAAIIGEIIRCAKK